MSFIIWVLVVFGITFILTKGKIFEPVRKALEDYGMRYLPNCPLCVGTWVGLLAGWLWRSPTEFILLDAPLGGICSYMLYLLCVNLGSEEL